MKDSTNDQERLRKQLQKLVQHLNEGDYQRKSYLCGQILTITDGALGDPSQRKAVKDLVNNAFYNGTVPYDKGPVESEVEQLAHALGLEGRLFPSEFKEAYDLKLVNPYESI